MPKLLALQVSEVGDTRESEGADGLVAEELEELGGRGRLAAEALGVELDVVVDVEFEVLGVVGLEGLVPGVAEAAQQAEDFLQAALEDEATRGLDEAVKAQEAQLPEAVLVSVEGDLVRLILK